MTMGPEVLMGDLVGDIPVATRPPDFEIWVATAGPDLMRFAVAVTGNAHDAADAVQDAMVAIYPRWRRIVARGGPDAYVRRIIVNRQISWWRRIGRRESAIEPPDLAATSTSNVADAMVADRLLHSLPVKQRAAVALRYLDDLSFAEIAEVLGCPESTARSHVHRALARLRTELEADHER
jgi:RNA polymerase sigma-70 factor (sigma-E family)